MGALAGIVREYRDEYYQRYRRQVLPGHRKAFEDIMRCRTARMGGRVYACGECDRYAYAYHSCNNRHCPQCGNSDITAWLTRQQALQLPVKYFLVTVTIPQELYGLAYAHQSVVYSIVMRSAARAVQTLAADEKFLGGRIGLMSILHTWTRDMRYHPHVHMLIPVGGISTSGDRWIPLPYHEFFIPAPVLAAAFRNTFMRMLKQTDLYRCVSPFVWHQRWVVHIKPAGTGTTVLKYLAPYVKRVAISNNRIESVSNRQVTFRYKDAKTDTCKHLSLDVLKFVNRFAKHILPRGFVKIRYYGYMGHTQRELFEQVQTLLAPAHKPAEPTIEDNDSTLHTAHHERIWRCPHCGAPMFFVREFKQSTREPP